MVTIFSDQCRARRDRIPAGTEFGEFLEFRRFEQTLRDREHEYEAEPNAVRHIPRRRQPLRKRFKVERPNSAAVWPERSGGKAVGWSATLERITAAASLWGLTNSPDPYGGLQTTLCPPPVYRGAMLEG